ncbi:MAG TPA: nucleotide exchange factor GrpE [Thermoanaerobaculia bacterium]|nr:nucleotide exchange factor GrpE [Thermoanaerobaculia bacterium]
MSSIVDEQGDAKEPAEAASGAEGADMAEGQIEVVWVEEDPADPQVEAPSQAQGSLQEENEQLRRSFAEMRDQYLRTVADLDNYRKRMERESRDIKRFALIEPMRDLLGVVDNLERALAAGGAIDDLKRGVEMTLLQFRDILRQHGVREIDATGTDFDPAVHDAVARFEDPGVRSPKVAEQLQRGYWIHDRLLRPALVRVAVPVPATVAAAGAEPEPPRDGG